MDGDAGKTIAAARQWPREGISRVPYWIYSDPDIYAREQERIFRGRTWNYVALEAEIPNPGDFRRGWVGDKSVVVVRDEEGGVSVVENRCAHRGVRFCQKHLGNNKELMCPYHQWTYDLRGNLVGVPFRRGLKGQGAMSEDFDPAEHGLRKLAVARRNGVVFASYAEDMPPIDQYMTPELLTLFDRTFDGRELKVLGYSRQLTPANWKLMFENIKDPYHATLLHVFLVTFGLQRADQQNRMVIDPNGLNAASMGWRGEQKQSADTAEMRSMVADLALEGKSMLQAVDEFRKYTIVMMTLWPSLIVQQQSNTLAMRQIVPRGPDAFELSWTFFGYAGDDEEMTLRRLRQSNLMGPSGYVSVDDSEVLAAAQQGIGGAPDSAAVLELDGRSWSPEIGHMVTEGLIRALYDGYRRVMEL